MGWALGFSCCHILYIYMSCNNIYIYINKYIYIYIYTHIYICIYELSEGPPTDITSKRGIAACFEGLRSLATHPPSMYGSQL